MLWKQCLVDVEAEADAAQDNWETETETQIWKISSFPSPEKQNFRLISKGLKKRLQSFSINWKIERKVCKTCYEILQN